jgi:hypothetical protein
VKEHALALAAQGFKVFPIAPGQKAPPLLNGWPQKATSDAAEVEMFWLAVPNANIGIHCEGLLVIDVDVKKGGNESLELLRLQEDLPATLCTNTPSGGGHYFYSLPLHHEGVPNGVETLGRGLDIRSTGGYVVAPGSVVAAGTYAFADPTREIAPAPDWLVQRLGVGRSAQPRDELARDRIPDAEQVLVERARVWLAGQLPAVQGQGGDARTFAVACGLRDLGVSREQALELLRSWNLLCMPPWSDQDLAQKVTNAYRYAENEAGSKAAQLEDFPIVECATSAPSAPSNAAPRSGTRTINDLADDRDIGPGYAIKGVLQRASYAEVFGAPGEGKTFIALDMAYAVASGLPWMGRKVHAGPVLYLAYEGQGGLKKRAKALLQKYGAKPVPLYVESAAFNLRELAGRAALGAVLATLPEKPVLVVIDTLARALMGGDENSAQDVGSFNTAVAALIANTGACVMIVHHSGKDKSKGARGSSALQGAIDTEIEVDSGQVIPRKQRDVELLPPIGFKLRPVLVGVDSDGDELTSCVVEPASVIALNGRLKPGSRKALVILEEMAPDNKPVQLQAWLAECKEQGISRSAFYIAKRELEAAARIVCDGDNVTRKMA